jgi:ElaB/YqjD/DUF883 family membrane-anchored ribosome-binding protein
MAEGTESIRQDIDAIRGSMTDTMEQIESRVKGTVDTTVENVKRTFDVKQQISDQPWAALGIAVVAGYMLGSMGSDSESDSAPAYMSAPDSLAKAAPASTPNKPGILDDVIDQFGDELNVLKSAAIAMAVTMVRDTIAQNMPQLAKMYQRAQPEPQTAASARPAAPLGTATTSRESVGTHLNGGVHS